MLELGEERPPPRTEKAPGWSQGPCRPLRLTFSGLRSGGSAPKHRRGASRDRSQRSATPPSSPKPRACLIMINCHMDNQIQFQKVGNDIPRTPGKTQNLPLFPGRKGRSLTQPRNLLSFCRFQTELIPSGYCSRPGDSHVSCTISAAVRVSALLSTTRCWGALLLERAPCHVSAFRLRFLGGGTRGEGTRE